MSIYKKHKFFLLVRWNSAKMKKDIVDLIFGKHSHLNLSWMLNFADLELFSFFLYREKMVKISEKTFFSPASICPKILNILKYAAISKNSFKYRNISYYIIEYFIILMN